MEWILAVGEINSRDMKTTLVLKYKQIASSNLVFLRLKILKIFHSISDNCDKWTIIAVKDDEEEETVL